MSPEVLAGIPNVPAEEGLLCEGGPSRSGRRPCESPHMRAPAMRRGVEVAHEQELNSDRKTAG